MPASGPGVLPGGDAGVERARLVQRLLAHRDHRVDLRVQPLDPLERRADELLGRRLPVSHRA